VVALTTDYSAPLDNDLHYETCIYIFSCFFLVSLSSVHHSVTMQIISCLDLLICFIRKCASFHFMLRNKVVSRDDTQTQLRNVDKGDGKTFAFIRQNRLHYQGLTMHLCVQSNYIIAKHGII